MNGIPDLQPGDRVQTLITVPGICKAEDVGYIKGFEGGDRAEVRFGSPPGSDKLPFYASIAVTDLRRV